MTKIAFYRLNSEGRVPSGTIALQGGALAINPPDSQLLQNIAAQPVYDRENGVWVGSDDPETWLSLLPTTYRSPYLHAEAVDSAPARKVKASPFGQRKGLFTYSVKGGRPCHVGETSSRTGCVPESELEKKQGSHGHPKLMTSKDEQQQAGAAATAAEDSGGGSSAGAGSANGAATQGLSPEDQNMVEDWLHIGVPGLRGKADGDKLVDYLVRVLPSHPLYGLAVLEALERLKESGVQMPTPENPAVGTSGSKSLPAVQKPQPGFAAQRNGKQQPKVPGVKKESYFATCERDEHGHCLPKGQMGRRAVKKDKQEENRASYQGVSGLLSKLENIQDKLASIGGDEFSQKLLMDLMQHAPPDSEAAKARRSVLNYLLSNDLRVRDAVKYLNTDNESANRNTLLSTIAQGDLTKVAKEYSSTPLFDLNVLSKITLSNDPVPGQAVCFMSTQAVKMGSTSKTGDFRHELGHAIHASFGIGMGGAFDKAIQEQYQKVMQRVAANPAGKHTKMAHEWYEENYGVMGSRALDNDKENFAEHYRGYHKAIYQDKQAGNDEQLNRYRKLHPEMAKLFDTYYTANLVAQNQANELDIQHAAKVSLADSNKNTASSEQQTQAPSAGQAMVEAAKQQPEPPKPTPSMPAWQEPAQEFTQPLPTNGIIDVSHWSNTNGSAKWAAKKIKQYEDLAKAGKWDQLEQIKYVPTTAKPNNYCKTVIKAYEKLKMQQAAATPSEPKPTSQWKTIQNWQKVGDQKGSNPGAVMLDEHGTKHYVKTPSNPKHAHSEVLAAKLYELAGAGVPSVELVQTQTGMGVASKWLDGAQAFNKDNDYQKSKVQENFAVHAWLANWDAAGAAFDNQVMTLGDKAVTVDCGGSLTFRAQGGTKEFGATPTEWQSLRDPTKNKNAAAIFGNMTDEQLMASAAKVSGISDAAIDQLVDKFAPDDQKEMLKTNLKKRRDYIKGFAAGIAEKIAGDKAATQATEDEDTITLSGHNDELPLELDNSDEPELELTNPDETGAQETSGASSTELSQPPSDFTNSEGYASFVSNHLFDMAKDGKLAELESFHVGVGHDADTKLKEYQQKLIAEVKKQLGEKPASTKQASVAPALPPKPTVMSVTNQQAQKKFDSLWNAAQTGDIAKVEAIPTMANAKYTYAKQHHKYKMALLAAMGQGAKPTADSIKASNLPQPPIVAWPDNKEAVKKMYELATTGKIDDLKAYKHPPSSKVAKYKETLIAAMSEGVTQKHSSMTEEPKEAPPQIDASKFPEPPEFVSKNETQVASNKKAVQDMLALAEAGKYDDLVAFAIPPSPKLKEWKQSLEQNLHAQQHPPKPPKTYKGALEAIAKVFKATEWKGKVESCHKIGHYLITEEPGVPEMEFDFSKGNSLQAEHGYQLKDEATRKAHVDALQKMNESEKSVVRSYTGHSSSSINNALRGGYPSNSSTLIGQTIMKHALPLPTNGRLYRGMSVSSDVLEKIQKSVGTVVEEPGVSSTSLHQRGGNLQWNFLPAKGARGLYVQPISHYPSEAEMLLPPGARYLITKVRKPNPKNDTIIVDAVLLATTPDQCC